MSSWTAAPANGSAKSRMYETRVLSTRVSSCLQVGDRVLNSAALQVVVWNERQTDTSPEAPQGLVDRWPSFQQSAHHCHEQLRVGWLGHVQGIRQRHLQLRVAGVDHAEDLAFAQSSA